MKTIILSLFAAATLTSHVQAYGSEGFMPDAYWRFIKAVLVTDVYKKRAILPAGTIVHVLWYLGNQPNPPKGDVPKFSEIMLKDGSQYEMRWGDMMDQEYLGLGTYCNRPF
jgi:hypothetical protein